MYFEKVFPLKMLFIRELSHFITRVLHFEVDKLIELMGLELNFSWLISIRVADVF